MIRALSTVALAVLVGLASPACDDDDDDGPLTPSDETITFIATLSPANEVPAVTGAEATGGGTATIVLHVDRGVGNDITDASADFQVALGNFPPGTSLTGAHVHRGTAGDNGDIVVNTGLTPGEVQLTTGAGAFSEMNVDVAAGLAEQIVANPSQFYFNVHSATNPNGVARGQLVRQ
jgi:hypothetical protein